MKSALMLEGMMETPEIDKLIDTAKHTDMMIALIVTHENSNKGTMDYFFGDTLEYANRYTEWQNREAFCEFMDNPEDDPTLH